MVRNDFLIRTYKDIPYDKRLVFAREILDECYVFDISDGGIFIAQRAARAHNLIGKSIYDIMSAESIDEMVAHLTSYTDTPMFVSTTRGIAIAIPSLVPSCSLGVLVFAIGRTDDVFRAARVNKLPAKYERSLIAHRNIRHNKSSLANEYRSLLLMSRLKEIFSGTHAEQLLTGDITRRIEETIYAVSYYVGCPVTLVCDSQLRAVADFDYSLFVGFILISLMCVREYAPTREAIITLGSNDFGVTVRVNAMVTRQCPDIYGIKNFRKIANRKRMLFEFFKNEREFYALFSPICKDWSLLGIKSPSYVSEEEELKI